MHESSRRIEFVVGVAEAEFLQYPARRGVVGMMSGKERFHSKRCKRKFDDSTSRLRCQAHAPAFRPQIKSHIKTRLARPGRTQSSTSGVLTRRQQEHRPILHIVRF